MKLSFKIETMSRLGLDIKEEQLNENSSMTFPGRDKEMTVPLHRMGMGRTEKR